METAEEKLSRRRREMEVTARRRIERMEEKFGKTHPVTLYSYADLACCLVKQGKEREAEEDKKKQQSDNPYPDYEQSYIIEDHDNKTENSHVVVIEL